MTEQQAPESATERVTRGTPLGSAVSRTLLELAIVVFGVLLGLWLNGQQTQRSEAKFVAKSVRVIESELARNFDAVVASRGYHMKLLPKLIAARDAQRAQQPAPPLKSYYGFQTAPTTSAAYQTALSAGVFAKLDPEYSAKVAHAYLSLAALSSTGQVYRTANAIGVKPFLETTPVAFADLMYKEDSALSAIGAVTGQKVPKPWHQVLDVKPY